MPQNSILKSYVFAGCRDKLMISFVGAFFVQSMGVQYKVACGNFSQLHICKYIFSPLKPFLGGAVGRELRNRPNELSQGICTYS